MKDDPDQIAMAGPQRKASTVTIACMFIAAAVIGGLLLVVPGRGILSETNVRSDSLDRQVHNP